MIGFVQRSLFYTPSLSLPLETRGRGLRLMLVRQCRVGFAAFNAPVGSGLGQQSHEAGGIPAAAPAGLYLRVELVHQCRHW